MFNMLRMAYGHFFSVSPFTKTTTMSMENKGNPNGKSLFLLGCDLGFDSYRRVSFSTLRLARLISVGFLHVHERTQCPWKNVP